MVQGLNAIKVTLSVLTLAYFGVDLLIPFDSDKGQSVFSWVHSWLLHEIQVRW